MDEILGFLGVHGLEQNREDGIVLEFILYPEMRNEQVHITVIRVPRKHKLNTIQHQMDDLLPYGVVEADEANAQTRDLHNELVGVLHLFFLDLSAQLELLYVVLEDEAEIEMPNNGLLLVPERNCLGV